MYYKNMIQLKEQYHSDCIFNSDFFHIDTSFTKEGVLTGSFDCKKIYQGYSGRMHGGILSGIIDFAMTLFLFGHNIVAYTVRLNIKYSHPVKIGETATIKVKLHNKQNNFLYNVTAAIYQDNKKIITADAIFWLEKDLNKEDL